MSTTYDAIVLGAGHNGLVLQAYLARAGLSTLCLERRSVIGGGLTTEEYPAGSGFLHNTHSFFHRALDRMPWYHDLGLQQHGARYIQPELNVAMLLRDGRMLGWWTDFAKTVASFASFSPQDARALERWRDRFRPIVEKILVPESQAPPIPTPQRERLLGQSESGRLLLETSRLSPIEFVQREFSHPAVQAGLLFFNGLREVDLRLPGFGHHIPALLASDGMAQMCLGGSKQLADALVSVIRESGGNLKTDTTPQEIIVENGKAAGVRTTDGELFHATKVVASSLNPQQTFIELIDDAHLPGSWIQQANSFQYNLLAPLFGLNLNLKEPPRYAAGTDCPELDNAFMVILGLEHVDQFGEIVDCHEQGRIPPTVMWGACPTRFDSTQAPDDRHVAFMWEKLPYKIQGDAKRWDHVKDDHGRKMLDLWSSYAANVADPLACFTRSPLDTEQALWNMRGGDLLVGAFSHGQIGDNRPFAGAGQYRGHLPHLYLCGSSCHPGGNVTGLPGYNAAQVILADIGLPADWAPMSIEDRLAKL